MIIAVNTGGTKTRITRFDYTGKIARLAIMPAPKDTDDYTNRVSEQIKPLPQGQVALYGCHGRTIGR